MSTSGSPTGSQRSTLSTNTAGNRLGGLFNKTINWIGGPPLKDFSGPHQRGPTTPLCFRGLDATSEIKGFTKRTEGSVTKFKRDDSDFTLVAFADEALKHMQLTGMDTVFCVTGADANGEGAEELFTYHTRCTKAAVDQFIKNQLDTGVFDECQRAALQESALWLSNSLDESLKPSLRTQLASRPTGPQLWMSIVSEVQSDSLKRVDNLTKRFEKMTLADFKGESVRDYCTAAGEILTQLERDNQSRPTHLVRIIDVFSACTVMDFKIHFMSRRSDVQRFVRDSAGKEAATVKAMSNYIHFQHLLDEGKELFLDLQEQWGPTKPAGPANAMISALQSLSAKVANLDQALKAKPGGGGKEGSDKKELKCFTCGKPGHTKKTCPDCNKGNGTPGGGSPPPKKKKPFKWAAPKDGEPQEKEIDGKPHKYCAKCKNGRGFWTSGAQMHGTAEHKNRPDGKPAAGGHVAAVPTSFAEDLFAQWSGIVE